MLKVWGKRKKKRVLSNILTTSCWVLWPMIQWSPIELGTFCLNSSDTWRSSAEMPLSFSSSCSCEVTQGKDLNVKKPNTIWWSSWYRLHDSFYCNYKPAGGFQKHTYRSTYEHTSSQHLHFSKKLSTNPCTAPIVQLVLPGLDSWYLKWTRLMCQTCEAMTRNLKCYHQEVLSLFLIWICWSTCPKQYVSGEIQRKIGNFHVGSPGFKLQSGLELVQADGILVKMAVSFEWKCEETWWEMVFTIEMWRKTH